LAHIREIFPQFTTFPWIDKTKAPTADESFAAVARARKYGLNMGLFKTFITYDFEKPRQNLIYLDASPLGMERSFYLKENGTELPAYEQYLTDVLHLFAEKVKAGQVKRADASSLAKEIIAFEIDLAKVGRFVTPCCLGSFIWTLAKAEPN
jgi:predicted metalloendopeptidase